MLLTQADMFDPTVAEPEFADYYAFQPIVQAHRPESAAFDGPVYLFNGDSHVFNTDQPLAAGSSWLSFYGVTGRSTIYPDHRRRLDRRNDYLRVTVRPSTASVLTVEKVPFTS